MNGGLFGGTAVAGADYTEVASGRVTFPAGPSSDDYTQTLTVPIINNNTPEGTEFFSILYQISTPFDSKFVLRRVGQAPRVTIEDDDAPPVLTAPLNINRDEVGGSVRVLITMDQASDLPVSFDWTTAATTALANRPPLGNDFYNDSGTITIIPGQTRAGLDVDINDDRYDEPTETLNVLFTNVVNATFPIPFTRISIIDNDLAPLFKVEAPEGGVKEYAGFAVFTVTLVDPNGSSIVSGKDASFTYSTQDGTNSDSLLNAVAGNDYTATSGTMTIPSGMVSGTITVPDTQRPDR